MKNPTPQRTPTVLSEIKSILWEFDAAMQSARKNNYGEHIINAKEIAEEQAEQALLAWVEGIIGEDEVTNPEDLPEGVNVIYDYGVAQRAGRNKLRAEMRKAAGL